MKRVLSLLLILALAVSAAPAVSAADEYGIGEVWTEDGLFSVVVLSVTETEERSEYSDRDPAAVYIVDYAYANLGYEDGYSDGLYVRLTEQVVDAEGELGYNYPGSYAYYPAETPIGAVCCAQCCVGVDNAGDFKLYVTVYDNDGGRRKAVFNIDTEAEPADPGVFEREEALAPFEGAYRIGETWTVDGLWSLTITGITETKERNQYADTDPEAVYIIDYTYKNLGYESEYSDGLYLAITDRVVDNVGFMGWAYPGEVSRYPKATPVGATCKAQACVGVLHPGAVQLIVMQFDGENQRHSAAFFLGDEPEPKKPEPTAEPAAPADEPAEEAGEIGAELREFMEEYEECVDEYAQIMLKFMNATPGEMLSLMGEYSEKVEKFSEFAKKLKQFDTSKLTEAELKYYNDVIERKMK